MTLLRLFPRPYSSVRMQLLRTNQSTKGRRKEVWIPTGDNIHGEYVSGMIIVIDSSSLLSSMRLSSIIGTCYP